MEYLHTSGRPLSDDERNRFSSFRTAIREQWREGNLLFLYRGDERRHLRRMLAREGEQITEAELAERLFLFGAKARHYFLDNPQEIDRRAYFRTINDVGEATFAHVFDRVANVLQDNRTDTPARLHCSEAFRTYFIDRGSREHFLARIMREPDMIRLRIRDYYLFFLHAAGGAGVREETFLVSTSVQRTVAADFAQRRNTRIIEYFVPQPFYKFVVAPWLCDQAHRRAHVLGLPTFQPLGIFPHQEEVAVKGALLPHFIVGIRDFQRKTYVPNPHIFAMRNIRLREVMRNGIPVDQSQFEATVFSTGYHRYGAIDQRGNFAEFVVPPGPAA